MSTTFAENLKSTAVDWKTLHKNYNPLLNLVKELIGIIPNCDPILEIWPPGFRTYNLLVPNLFNLPNTLFGSKSFKAAMGLAMYASSKAACAYCTAHACSFALRRGARTEAIAGSRTAKEQTVVALAEGLAHIPASLTRSDIEAVRHHFSPSETEWLVYSISMMGFLNKFMNAMGVELEQGAINDTAQLLSKTGWKPGIHTRNGYQITKQSNPEQDNIFTYLRIVRQAPGAVLWEKKWTRHVPSDFPTAGAYLEQHTGYSFPILKPIKEGRVLRTLTVTLQDNLNAALSITGLKIKLYSGYIYCMLVGNDVLTAEMKNLSTQFAPELSNETYKQMDELSQSEIPTDVATCEEMIRSMQQRLSLNQKESAAILLAAATSYSPAQVNDAVIETTIKYMEPAGIVETVVWLSVLQLLNRLSSYYTVIKAY